MNPKSAERSCPVCGELLRYTRCRARWHCDNPDCPVAYVIFHLHWKPLKEPMVVYASESRRVPL